MCEAVFGKDHAQPERRMSGALKVSVGQHSDKGRKPANQDFHGVLLPKEPLLSLKGVAVVLADGISSSNVTQIASESTVKSFLTDYYCTSESWSVKTAAQRVIAATNSWLYGQTRRSHGYRIVRDLHSSNGATSILRPTPRAMRWSC
jgi:serine/threonine protein phosphatase PrpC